MSNFAASTAACDRFKAYSLRNSGFLQRFARLARFRPTALQISRFMWKRRGLLLMCGRLSKDFSGNFGHFSSSGYFQANFNRFLHFLE